MQTKINWIKASEQKPQIKKDVFMKIKTKLYNLDMGYWDGEEWVAYGFRKNFYNIGPNMEVEYWAEIPKEYLEEPKE